MSHRGGRTVLLQHVTSNLPAPARALGPPPRVSTRVVPDAVKEQRYRPRPHRAAPNRSPQENASECSRALLRANQKGRRRACMSSLAGGTTCHPRVFPLESASDPPAKPTQAVGKRGAEVTKECYHSKAPQPQSTRGRTKYQRHTGCSRVG